MTETLKKLIELQALDSELFLLNRQMADIPKSLRLEQAKYEKAMNDLHHEEQAHKQMDEQRKKMELDIADDAEHVRLLKGKQGQIKKNVEFQALTQEIKQAEESEKKHRAAVEQQVEMRKTLGEQHDEKKKNVMAQKEDILQKAERAKREIGELQARINRHKLIRRDFAKQISGDAMVLYTKLLKTRAPTVVVPVRRGGCTGCHIKLPAQVIADIIKADKLVVCDSCARILYVDTNAAEIALK